jgi:hypothetical protein
MKHKEQVSKIVELAVKDAAALTQVFTLLKTGSDVEKGTAAEVLKFVSKECPEKMLPYVDLIVDFIDYKAPRVKWGCPEAIGNLAPQYPREVESAIPKLLKNLDDSSTVVRWCAAFALTEIARHNTARQNELVGLFEQLLLAEQNSGVKNLYVKTLKRIQKAGR